MKRDNRGLSLIELIVVIAIMAIMIGVGILSISLLFGTQARGCAQKVSSMLNETKTGCLSRFDETMTIAYRTKGQDGEKAYTADGYYAINRIYTLNNNAASVAVGGAGSSEIRALGSGKVVIMVYLSDGSSFELGTDKYVTISFNRSTGAFDPVIVGDTFGETQTDDYIDKITFSSGARTYTLTMVQATGKHTVEG